MKYISIPKLRSIFILAIFSALFIQCRVSPEPTIATPEIKGLITDKAMIVSAHPLATEAGVAILKKGGNAVDAAVAVHFALAVVHPSAGNIGGGGFMVMRAANAQTYALDFREKAPRAASRDMYLDSDGEVIENLSWRGARAAGVPGSVAGLVAAHDSLGSLPWAELLAPAIALAREGFTLTEKEAEGINNIKNTVNRYSTRPTIFENQDQWQKGDSIKHPQLATTLSRIAEQGNAGFYAGETARLIVAEMQRNNGIMTLQDLADYDAVWRKPIQGDYRGHEIISMPPPSSGGIALLQLLEMVEPFPLSEYGHNSADAVHLMAEAERRVYADRAKHLGDADYYPVPRSGLIKADYLLSRMADFNANQASDSDDIEAGMPASIESEQTTHYSIVDSSGMAVSITTTLNGSFGSCAMVGGAGFLLNNEMDDFSSKPGTPNKYGLLGAEANAIEPGKRMLSSMTPTIVAKGETLLMVVGTPGGSTIITSVFQNIVNVIDHQMGMQASVSAKRFHHQWKPDRIQIEANALTGETAVELLNRGHTIKNRSAIGRVDAILVLPDGRLEGGADWRGDDAAAGY
ncbi:MAG: gamma-glutamyltransferase [Bacteroidia bacterium]